MARPERFELPTTKFVAWYSIQLSYGRKCKLHFIAVPDDTSRLAKRRLAHPCTIARGENDMLNVVFSIPLAQLSHGRIRRPNYVGGRTEVQHTAKLDMAEGGSTPYIPVIHPSGQLRRSSLFGTNLSNRHVDCRGFESTLSRNLSRGSVGPRRTDDWRRGRDSNPRWSF